MLKLVITEEVTGGRRLSPLLPHLVCAGQLESELVILASDQPVQPLAFYYHLYCVLLPPKADIRRPHLHICLSVVGQESKYERVFQLQSMNTIF